MRKAVKKNKPTPVIGKSDRAKIEEGVKVNGVVPAYLRRELAPTLGNEEGPAYLEDLMQQNSR